MSGVTGFRWFNDKIVRDARKAYTEAHAELTEYGEHFRETHPRSSEETEEYHTLNARANQSAQALRQARP